MGSQFRKVAARMIQRWLLVKRRWSWYRQGVFVAAGTYVHIGTRIGRRTRINAPSFLGECTIGSYCAIGGRLVVRSSNHNTCYLNMQDWTQRKVVGSSVAVAGRRERNVEIGNAVWIGDSVIILPDVTIGNGSVIGAGSVVTRPVPAFSVAMGNPARVVKQRFPSAIVEIVKEIRWWEWSDDEIRRNRRLFEIDLTAIEPSELKVIVNRMDIAGHD